MSTSEVLNETSHTKFYLLLLASRVDVTFLQRERRRFVRREKPDDGEHHLARHPSSACLLSPIGFWLAPRCKKVTGTLASSKTCDRLALWHILKWLPEKQKRAKVKEQKGMKAITYHAHGDTRVEEIPFPICGESVLADLKPIDLNI